MEDHGQIGRPSGVSCWIAVCSRPGELQRFQSEDMQRSGAIRGEGLPLGIARSLATL